MYLFLSPKWFDYVAKCNDEVGDLPLSPNLQRLVINVQLENGTSLHLAKGKIWQGLHDSAIATVSCDQATLTELIASQEVNSALGAFLAGKIQIAGDMSALLTLKSAPSSELKAFYKQILQNTRLP